MPLRIYNTLTGQKEEFKPLNPPEVKMYVCGPTVYDEPHIGHLRSAYVFEVMRRWMEHSGYKVKFVRNVTDVDDKIIEKARQEGGDLRAATIAVSSKYFDLYKKDLTALGIQEPTVEPRATTHIAEMQKLIAALIQKGFAYHAAGSSDVYFEVKKFSSYGKLSKQKIEEMMDQARKESAPGKRDPLDFALWKGAKEGEPAWSFDGIGDGRPGWHIECSAMNKKCLGDQIDIHGGGLDLKFPHHENEIAQSEAATGKSFAKYWIHHGLITVNEQKMSKSLKNYTRLSDIDGQNQKPFSISDLKLLFISTHYSAALDYTEDAMKMQHQVWQRFFNFSSRALLVSGGKDSPVDKQLEEFDRQFGEAMNNDFNTPQALAVMHEMVNYAWKSSDVVIWQADKKIRKFGDLFGLFKFEKPKASNLIDEQIKSRNDAKRNKDFKLADQIRQDLLSSGIELIDQPDGTTRWRQKA